jgi:ankyrin repeat protein
MTTRLEFDVIKKGDLAALTAALDAGTDPNASDGSGTTLLMWSVVCNKLHMVDVLLSRGANIHHKDRIDQTTMHYAAFKTRSDVLFRTVFSAAGPRAMNFPNCYGSTPLHYLACNGSAEQMAFALSHPGLDVSIQNDLKCTPLHVSNNFRRALQTYGDQEARLRPMRYTWIKLLMLPFSTEVTDMPETYSFGQK